MVTYDSTPIDGVQLITGWGRSRKVTQHGDIRARAIATLDRMGLSTLQTDNPGRLVVQLERAADVEQDEASAACGLARDDTVHVL